MQYTIEDEFVIELEPVIKPKPEAEVEVVLPVITLSNEETPEISEIEFGSVSSHSIDLSFSTSVETAQEAVKGIIYSENADPTFESDSYKIGYGTGRFDLTIAGLRASTTYFFKPYALSNLGYKYGNVQSCQTSYSPIPEEYQLVEYLRNTGTQYIDTNYRPVETTVSTIKFYTNVAIPLVFYGYYGGNDSRDYRFFLSYFDIFGGRLIGFNFANRICEVELGNFYVEDLETHARYSGQRQQFIVGDYSIKIFGETSNTAPGDFYYAKISEDGEMVREMYPVYRKSDNKPGMYDIVNNVFYTNAGTGEFTVGPDKEWEG